MSKTWTEADIVALLDRSDKAVERAVVALHKRQTADEKQTDATRHDNAVGFRKNHAKRLSYYARLVGWGKTLYPSQLALARKWTKMYRRQLCEIANSQASTQEQAA